MYGHEIPTDRCTPEHSLSRFPGNDHWGFHPVVTGQVMAKLKYHRGG
jgi:hypothetical protein